MRAEIDVPPDKVIVREGEEAIVAIKAYLTAEYERETKAKTEMCLQLRRFVNVIKARRERKQRRKAA